MRKQTAFKRSLLPGVDGEGSSPEFDHVAELRGERAARGARVLRAGTCGYARYSRGYSRTETGTVV